jgi:hypothetical protein
MVPEGAGVQPVSNRDGGHQVVAARYMETGHCRSPLLPSFSAAAPDFPPAVPVVRTRGGYTDGYLRGATFIAAAIAVG